MMRVLLAAVLMAVMTFAAYAERRVALVFSADNYKTVRPLKNAGNDGLAIKAALEALDFEVFLETDRDLRRMRRALDDFREDAKGADAALVYFSGHGAEIAGENRLLPVDADASSLDALKASSLPLDEVREAVAEVGKIGLIVLDACRDDPFGASGGDGRGASALSAASKSQQTVIPGLGRMGRAENVLFAFSAAPGQTASDGAGGNSPFTAALAKYLDTEGLEIRSVLTLVQQEVYDLTQGKQLPYVESGLPRLFFAGAKGKALPERERLLLAMADITPDVRDQIERIAVDRDMPLAPLYGALISSSASSLSVEDRGKKLAEAASAFVKVRTEMRALASDDPRVTQLRQEAEKQLSLGAFDTARERLAEAAGIDSQSRQALKANFVGRTLSEAATRYLSGGAALADLRYQFAIADFEKAASLFAEVDGEDIPAHDQNQHFATLQALGGVYIVTGNLAKAGRAYDTMQGVAIKRAMIDPANEGWQSDLSVSYMKLGDVRQAQGDLQGSVDAYQEALDVVKQLVATAPDFPGWQLNLSDSYAKLGDVRVMQGNISGAAEAYETGVAIRTRLVARDPGYAGWKRPLLSGYNKIGDLRMAQGDLHAAREAYEAALDIATQLAAADPANTSLQFELSTAHIEIGDVLLAEGNPSGSLKAYNAAREFAARLAAADPANSGLQRRLSIAHMKVGDVQAAQRDLFGAVETYEAALGIATQLAVHDPRNAGWQSDLATAYGKIGDARLAQRRLTAAYEAYAANTTIVARLAAQDPGNGDWQRNLSIAHTKMGDLRFAQGSMPSALEAYRASFKIAERLAASDPANAVWQRDLMVLHGRVARAGEDAKFHLGKALEIALELERTGRLAPSDSYMPGALRKEVARLGLEEK